MHVMIRRYIFLATLLVLPVLVYLPAAADRDPWYTTATVSPDAPEWTPFPGIEISSEGAGIPQLSLAPNGNLLIVYEHWVSSDVNRDPYAAVSFDGGQSWTDGFPILSSPTVDSLDLDVVYDGNSDAHAVWVERVTGNYQLRYRRMSAANPGVWDTDRTISNIVSSNPLMANPAIFATGNDTLDVVWVEADQNNITNQTADVYHARSVDNGATWTKTGMVYSVVAPISLSPDLFVDSSGIAHVVWQESAPLGLYDVLYVRSDSPPNNGSVTWTAIDAPLNSLDADIEEAQEPAIAIWNGRIYVTFTDLHEDDLQTVVLARCTVDCEEIGNWALASISGEAVSVNSADPAYVKSQIARNDDTIFVYFHGTDPNLVDDNEAIWGVNQCENWAGSGRDQVTPTNIRSINPALTATTGKLHLAYELVSPGSPDEIHQIHYMSASFDCQYFIYMPTAAKP